MDNLVTTKPQSKLARLLLILVLLAVAVGQLVRPTLSQAPRVTVTGLDIALGLSLVIGIFDLLFSGQLRSYLGFLFRSWFWRLLVIFSLWALLSLIVNGAHYPHIQTFTAFAYWLRLVTTFFFVSYISFSALPKADIRRYLIMTAIVLVAGGFIQLLLFPDFSFMAQYGRDPHAGRMLGTFFDPSYFGLAAILAMTLLLIREWQSSRRHIWGYLVLIISWLALYLTFSRSAWLTGAVVLVGLGFYRSWRWGVALLIIFGLVLVIPNRLGSRLAQVGSIFNQNVTSGSLSQTPTSLASQVADPSAAARVLSFRKGLQLVKGHLALGVGYNAYGYASSQAGLTDTTVSSPNLAGQGVDDSLLNILVTTGVIGLLLFLAILVTAAKQLWQIGRSLTGTWWSRAAFFLLIGWIIGSVFNNTLLYLFLAVPFWLIITNELRSEANNVPVAN